MLGEFTQESKSTHRREVVLLDHDQFIAFEKYTNGISGARLFLLLASVAAVSFSLSSAAWPRSARLRNSTSCIDFYLQCRLCDRSCVRPRPRLIERASDRLSVRSFERLCVPPIWSSPRPSVLSAVQPCVHPWASPCVRAFVCNRPTVRATARSFVLLTARPRDSPIARPSGRSTLLETFFWKTHGLLFLFVTLPVTLF